MNLHVTDMNIQLCHLQCTHEWNLSMIWTSKPDARRRCIIEAPLTVDCVWNVMAHAQKPDFVFRPNGRVHLNRPGGGGGGQFSRLLAGELCTSASRVCNACASLCSAVMWRLLVTHSTLLFPLHFSSRVPSHFKHSLPLLPLYAFTTWTGKTLP